MDILKIKPLRSIIIQSLFGATYTHLTKARDHAQEIRTEQWAAPQYFKLSQNNFKCFRHQVSGELSVLFRAWKLTGSQYYSIMEVKTNWNV